MTKTVGIISLGCDKNRVDTEKMLFNLNRGGFMLTADLSVADVIIINTCAFIESARKEAIDHILAAAHLKKDKCCKLIVTGCLPQKYHADIKTDLPEVDAFLGTADYENIAEIIDSLFNNEKQEQKICVCGNDDLSISKRILTTPAHYAYIKIADGCDNLCTFCTIPSIRGKYRSRTIESIVLEAQGLVDSGVKELILVAQDVTRYGIDLYNEYKLVELIRQLSKTDINLIRLMYCYPELVSAQLINEIDLNEKVAKYIDIPIQHADDGILKLMNRRGMHAQLEQLFNNLRATKNSIAIRTTVMVGFPSETPEQFKTLYNFIEKYKPQHVGVFAYSTEQDTPSAKIKNHVSLKDKKQRVKAIGELHLSNVRSRKNSLIGKTLRVLYEDIDFDKNLFKGRTQYDAPEIDTNVYFSAEFADVGCFYDVKITGYNEYDLIGEVVK